MKNRTDDMGNRTDMDKNNDLLISGRKMQIRRIVMERRRACSEAALADMSEDIAAQILRLDVYRSAKTIFAYMDLPGEVQTRTLIGRGLADGKKVALPRVEGQRMRFYGIGKGTGLTQGLSGRQDPGYMHLLLPGAMGILEPDPSRCPCMDDEEDALIIMPGVAFDKDRNRIGYGGGFYDRYLQAHPAHPTVAAAFRFQIFDAIPHGAEDIRPQIIVTES